MALSKEAKQNIKFGKAVLKAWGSTIWNSSTEPVRYVMRVLRDSPKAIDDIVQLVVNIDDFDNIINQAIDIINDTDLITNGIETSVETAKKHVATAKRFFKEVKQIRKENIEMEKNKKNKNKSSSTGTYHTARTTCAKSATAKTNHPEWYLKDKTMVNSLVGINVSNRLNAKNGYITSFNVYKTGAVNEAIGEFDYGIPSCAAVEMELTIPKSITNDWQQAVNLLYKNIRSANAGAINYSPAQLANYIFTVRGIDAVLSHLGRCIKGLNSGSFYDALSPQAMFAAFGVDYDSFAANAANARELYSRLSAIRYRLMPLNITLLDRTRWLFSNVFKDSNDAKAQLYIPTVQRVPYLTSQNEQGYATIGSENITATTTGVTWEFYSEQCLEIFNVYQSDSVFQIIAGDILKAYGPESNTRYPEITMDMTIEPVFDEHILTQIQNASLSVSGDGVVIDYNTPTVSSDTFVDMTITDIVAAGDTLNYLSVALPLQAELLNRWIVNPTYNTNENVTDPGRLLSSTRLMVSRHIVNGTDQSGGTATCTYDTYGTEIVNTIRVILVSEKRTDKGIYDLLDISLGLFAPTGLVGNGSYSAATLPVWSWFDYFPFVIPKFVDNVNGLIGYSAPLFDFNNFGIAYKSNLDSYNAICTLSMLHKPFVTRVSNVTVIES